MQAGHVMNDVQVLRGSHWLSNENKRRKAWRLYSLTLDDACVVEDGLQSAVFPEQAVLQVATVPRLAPRSCALLVALVRLQAQDA
jgi:hypothetical protein